MRFQCPALVCLLALGAPSLSAAGEASLRELSRRAGATTERRAAEGQVALTVREAADGPPIAARLRLRRVDGPFVDASGRGAYADGRSFVDGKAEFNAPAGTIEIEASAGPERISLARREFTLAEGEVVALEIILPRWFSARERGWYSGDNHVHAQHDRVARIRTGHDYAALQARANGLAWISEAGVPGTAELRARLSRPDFIFAQAEELRPGVFVGHVVSPGIRKPLARELRQAIESRPLPARALAREIRRLGGVSIHTHPLTPPHLLHWMGATELFSDIVLGEGTDLLDLDGRASEELYAVALELGLRVAASSYTDCALGRERTLSPGDRRVWVRAEEFTLQAIVEGLRRGRTFASNGGPLFVFLRVGGEETGARLARPEDGRLPVRLALRSLHPLREVELRWRGRRWRRFETGRRAARDADLVLEEVLALPAGERAGFVTARVEDVEGHWAVTSPVWVGEAEARPREATLLTIANHTRFIELRREFTAHFAVTVDPTRAIEHVELLRDEERVTSFDAKEPGRETDGPVPLSGIRGEYSPGGVWDRENGRALHFQGDWPVAEAGWYRLRARLASGERFESDRVHFDPRALASRAYGAATLRGGESALRWWGYGEEMPLSEIQTPFEGDHWWYPRRASWRLESALRAEERVLGGGRDRRGLRFIRRAGEPKARAPEGRLRLLDDAHLEAWYSWLHGTGYRDPKRVFRARKGGGLEISGRGFGYLGTREAFRDYRVSFEYRFGENVAPERQGKARDAGLFLHAQGPDGNSHDGDGAFRSALECQLFEGATGDLLLIRGDDAEGRILQRSLRAEVAAELDPEGWPRFQPGGKPRRLETWGRLDWRDKDPAWKDIEGFRGARDVESPHGEWTRVEVTCRADTIEVRVNGELVNRATEVKPASGHLLFQCEGAEVSIRDFVVEPLS